MRILYLVCTVLGAGLLGSALVLAPGDFPHFKPAHAQVGQVAGWPPLQPSGSCPNAPPSTNLWGWWYTDGGSYTSTSGTPTGLISTDGTAIGTIADESGNGRHFFQATAAQKPIYKTNQIGGLAASQLTSGTSQMMATLGIPSPNTPLSGFFVANASAWTAGNALFGTDGAPPNGPVYLILQEPSSPGIEIFNKAAGSPTNMSLSSWHVVSGIVNGSTSSELGVDNNTPVTGALTGGGGGTVMQWGANTGNTLFWNGYIAEAILYTDNLTSNSGNGLLARQYLSCKYKIIAPPVTLGSGADFGNTASTRAITTGPAIVSGDLAAFCTLFHNVSSTTVASVSDGVNNYTKAASVNPSGSTELSLWYKANAAPVAASSTVTFTLSGAPSGTNIAWSTYGWRSSGFIGNPLDQTVTNSNASGSTVSSTTGTLSKANELVAGCAGMATGGGAYSGSSGFTNLGQATASVANYVNADYKIVSATTASTYANAYTASGNPLVTLQATFEGN